MLAGQDRAIARLALVLAKAPFQVDETLVEEVLSAVGAKNDSSAFWHGCRFPAHEGSPSESRKRQAAPTERIYPS